MGLTILFWFGFYKYAAPDGAGDGATPKKATGTSRSPFKLVGNDVRRLKYSATSF